MNFEKYHYGSRELVAFVDESGDPSLKDPNNPIFVLALCATYGNELNSTLRLPWLEVRKAITGSKENPIHMRELQRRIRLEQLKHALDFFTTNTFLRISFVITDKTVFEHGEMPKPPILELALESLLSSLSELITKPTDAVSIIFEDGPLIKHIRPHWPNRKLDRSDGITTPVSWAKLSKKAKEPGLEIADFIAHSAAGYFRNKKSKNSVFYQRYKTIHPEDNDSVHKGLELREAKLISKNGTDI